MTDYVRSPWTCGRYNKENEVALMYNLIEGQSYYFEGYSAHVIGLILSVDRNSALKGENIALSTGIHIQSVWEFMETLSEVGLITDHVWMQDEIRQLQKMQGEAVLAEYATLDISNDVKVSPYDITSAEQAYSDALDKNQYVPNAMFELTYDCSERCIHCYNDGATRNDSEKSFRHRDEMGIEDYKRLIDELYDLGIYKVCLTGGDPFSKLIVWDIIDYLYQKDIAFDILTNGQSLSSDKLEKLIGYFPRFIGLSVYSAEEQIHDSITRVNGSLKRTLNVAEYLSIYGVPLSFKCVIFNGNVKSYHTVKELAEKYGAIPQFEVNLCNGVGGDTSIVKNLGLSPNIMEIVLRDPSVPIHISGGDGSGDVYYVKEMNGSPCRAGIDAFNITPEGEITPCCALPISFGNIKKDKFSEVITADSSLKRWRRTKIADTEECGRHDKCAYCILCVGNGYVEHGTPLKAASTNCRMAEIRYNLSQKLKEGNDPLGGLSVQEKLSSLSIQSCFSFCRDNSTNYRNEKWE